MTPAGTVLDPAGIPVLGPNQQFSPDIAFGPANYLIAWQDGRGDWEIYGSRVTAGGGCSIPRGS